MDKKRKLSGGYPSVDQFHSILQQISPQTKFTKGAIEGLRETYVAFMQSVASSLVRWDSLKEEEKIMEALNLNPTFQEFSTEAKELLDDSSPTTKPSKKRKKQTLTAQDAHEQERLLEQSMQSYRQAQNMR